MELPLQKDKDEIKLFNRFIATHYYSLRHEVLNKVCEYQLVIHIQIEYRNGQKYQALYNIQLNCYYTKLQLQHRFFKTSDIS